MTRTFWQHFLANHPREEIMPETRHPLLGNKDSRQFKIYRTEHPAVFRFNGIFYMEDFDRHYEPTFIGLTIEQAERILNPPKEDHGEMG